MNWKEFGVKNWLKKGLEDLRKMWLNTSEDFDIYKWFPSSTISDKKLYVFLYRWIYSISSNKYACVYKLWIEMYHHLYN